MTAASPVTVAGREPTLDVLRGFALLGILLVNIELMRGADVLRAASGDIAQPTGTDQTVQFLTGWLAAGKFLSSFAILFGIGAAMMVARVSAGGISPRRLLARRYTGLIVLGLAHMFLLFPGDILFAYGLAGMALLAFVTVQARTAAWWSAGIIAVATFIATGFAAILALVPQPPADDPFTVQFEAFFAERAEAAVAAFQTGSFGDVVVANAWEALIVQVSALITLPWVLALFLFGFAVARAGFFNDLAARRSVLRKVAAIALPVGLIVNLPIGAVGPTGAGMVTGGPEGMIAGAALVAQIAGAPVLAVGYLSVLALICIRFGATSWILKGLAAVGRMALSAYLLQSVLALIVFWGFGRYDRLTPSSALMVVAGIWVTLLVVCPLWLKFARFGPVEWLWRSWTYRRWQPLRA